MNRRVSLALALLAVALLAVGTGGFGASTADRSLEIAVVDDENALVGVEDETEELGNGNHRNVPLLTVENQAGSSPLTVTDVNIRPRDPNRALEKGQRPHVRGTSVEPSSKSTRKRIVADEIGCASNKDNEMAVVVNFTAYADGFAVELTRTVHIECTGDPSGGGPEGTADPTTDGEDD